MNLSPTTDAALSDHARASAALTKLRARASDIQAARAIRRQCRIRDEAELLCELENVIVSLDCQGSTLAEEFRDRLIDLCCDLEDAIDAPNRRDCPARSVGNLRARFVATPMGVTR